MDYLVIIVVDGIRLARHADLLPSPNFPADAISIGKESSIIHFIVPELYYSLEHEIITQNILLFII